MEAFSNKHVRVRKEHCFGSASCGVFADTPKRYWCRHFELGFSKFQSCAHENQLRLSVLPRPSLTHWERSKNNSHKSRRKSQILNIGIFTFFIDKTFFEIYQLYIVFNIRYVPSPPCRYVWFCVRTNVPELTHFIRPIPFRWNINAPGTVWQYSATWGGLCRRFSFGGEATYIQTYVASSFVQTLHERVFPTEIRFHGKTKETTAKQCCGNDDDMCKFCWRWAKLKFEIGGRN